MAPTTLWNSNSGKALPIVQIVMKNWELLNLQFSICNLQFAICNISVAQY